MTRLRHATAMDLVARPLPSPTESVRIHRDHSMAGLREQGGFAVRRIEARRRAWIAAAIERLAPRLAMDLGCEDGWIAEAYAAHVTELWLVDRDPELLAQCRLAAGARLHLVVADAEQVQALAQVLGERRLDLMILSALLEHLDEPRAILQRLCSLLAPGGRFLIYVPADQPILALKAALKFSGLGPLVRGLSLDPAPGHLHVFDRAAVAQLVAGLGVVEEIAFDPLCLGYRAIVRR